MSAILLQPGFGGKYTSETFAATDTAGLDTIDCSRCAQLAFQVTSSGATGNIDIEQTFDGVNWVSFIADLAITNGTVALKDITDGPFGVLRINPTDLTAGTCSVVIVGYPAQWSF